MNEDAATKISKSPARVVVDPQPASSHRLATVSASQILLNAASDAGTTRLSTSLAALDGLLGTGNIKKHSPDGCGGFARGTVNEIWGPPGSGTTAFALQVAHNALERNQGVIWLDSLLSTPQSRFSHLGPGLQRFTAPTLAHLLSLTHQSKCPAWLSLSTSSLLVLSDVHSLVDASYPRYTPSHLPEPARWAATRRSGVIGTLIGPLQRIAAVHNLVVLLTTGCATQTRPESAGAGAVLVPGIVGGATWDQGIANRFVLFRDFGLSTVRTADGCRESRVARYVGVQKLNGIRTARQDGVGHVVEFAIGERGRLYDATADAGVAHVSTKIRDPPAAGTSKIALGKRPFARLDDVGSDAEGEVDDVHDHDQDQDRDDSDGAFGWSEQDFDAPPEDVSGSGGPVTRSATKCIVRE